MLRIVLGLAVFGAVIELVQAIPALNRHSELADLVVDVLAAAVAGGVTRYGLWLARTRHKSAGESA